VEKESLTYASCGTVQTMQTATDYSTLKVGMDNIVLAFTCFANLVKKVLEKKCKEGIKKHLDLTMWSVVVRYMSILET
jgi:hypothetical protein